MTSRPPPVPEPALIEARLREASRLAGSLRPEDRLTTKIDLSPSGVTARLREASDLYDLCGALARAGAGASKAAASATVGAVEAGVPDHHGRAGG